MIDKLENILATSGSARAERVSQFQEEIWNGDEVDEGPAYEVLADLAYDLDFYEPNPGLRLEDKSFFGDDILQERILEAIKKLRDLSNEPPSSP